MRHPGEYKMALDSVRIACANAESGSGTAMLAEAMVLPNEAKKLLANLLRAPGHVVAGKTVITVRLAPAANRSEHDAIAVATRPLQSPEILTLPGYPAEEDPSAFQSQSV